MSNTVAILFKDYTPGAGRDASGNPKQGKVETRGKITVTNYESGESLTPSDVGLTEIDTIDLAWEEQVGGASGSENRLACYAKGVQEFYLLEEVHNTGVPGTRYEQIARTRDPIITFRATGDSAAKGELL